MGGLINPYHQAPVGFMYIPSYFAIEDRALIAQIIRDHSFGLLLSADGDGLVQTTPLPFHLDQQGKRLYGHMARTNPHWKGWRIDQSVTALFHGPHAYVSPRWYKTEPNVPTWNYVMVEARGRIKPIEDQDFVAGLLAEMAQAYEGPSGWRYDETPDTYRQAMQKAIIAFVIEIESIAAKAKLSQNRKPDDIDGAIAGLRASKDPMAEATADWMARLRPPQSNTR